MAKKKQTAGGGETQDFTCTGNVRHDGEAYGPGDTISLDREGHALMKSLGVVEDEWKAEADPAAN